MLALGFSSCRPSVDDIAKEFCDCKTNPAPSKCRDAWVSKYKNAKGTDAESQKLGQALLKCDPIGLMEVAPKME